MSKRARTKALPDAVCMDCGEPIEIDTCACGQSRGLHDSNWLGHHFIPLGCTCHTPKPDPEPERCPHCGYPPDACGCPRCPGCGEIIDPDCCHCGIGPQGHGYGGEEHSFVPMGCTCGYPKEEGSPFRIASYPMPWDGPALVKP